MNREEINKMASQWVTMATNDMKANLVSLANYANINVMSLAPILGMSKDSLQALLESSRTPTMEEFVKIMILTGNVLSVEPMNDEAPTPPIPPIPTRDEVRIPPHSFAHGAQQFASNMTQGRRPNPIPRFGRSIPVRGGNEPSEQHDEATTNVNEQANRHRSPFESMSRERLVRIIKKKLWDSEIDTFGATHDDLVKFLEGKDKQIREYQRMERDGKSPELMNFVTSLKKLVETNPNIKDIVKNLVKDL